MAERFADLRFGWLHDEAVGRRLGDDQVLVQRQEVGLAALDVPDEDVAYAVGVAGKEVVVVDDLGQFVEDAVDVVGVELADLSDSAVGHEEDHALGASVQLFDGDAVYFEAVPGIPLNARTQSGESPSRFAVAWSERFSASRSV